MLSLLFFCVCMCLCWLPLLCPSFFISRTPLSKANRHEGKWGPTSAASTVVSIHPVKVLSQLQTLVQMKQVCSVRIHHHEVKSRPNCDPWRSLPPQASHWKQAGVVGTLPDSVPSLPLGALSPPRWLALHCARTSRSAKKHVCAHTLDSGTITADPRRKKTAHSNQVI